MTTLTLETIENLLRRAEGPALDFKRDQYFFDKGSHSDKQVLLKSKGELLKDILAFANTQRSTPAYILIGVEEIQGGRSRVVGVKKHLDDSRLHQFVNQKTQKRVNFSYTPFTIGGYEIGVIEIEQAQDSPIYLKKRFGKVMKGKVYIRDGSSTSIASDAEVTEMSAAFEIRQEFRQEISRVEFVSQDRKSIEIGDIFVFPNLVQESEFDFGKTMKRLKSLVDLLGLRHALIRGDEHSGKTTLCRQLYLHLVDKGLPVILIDLGSVGKLKFGAEVFRKKYEEQFKGDFELWMQKSNRTVIIDDLSARDIELVERASELFDNVFVSTSVDNYIAYFADDPRLSDFASLKLHILKHAQQEKLIRRWKRLDSRIRTSPSLPSDTTIDHIEDEVNSIVIKRIVPRYPFFVLSILQTYQDFMPQGLRITAYGHCYHALIVAQLLRLGIASDDMDACFNFLGWLANYIRQHSNGLSTISVEEYKKFNIQYCERFLIKNSILNRLFDQHSPILTKSKGIVSFRSPYCYYFFLGRYLSEHYQDNRETIIAMVEKSYVKDNSLSLIFVIHHSNNQEILDEIVFNTLLAFEDRQPVRLDLQEVEVFRGLLRRLPADITTEESVEDVREAERDFRDELDNGDEDLSEESDHHLVNDIFKALKNMEILSQILKNKYGSIGKERLAELIETVLDAGLRLAREFLMDEREISEIADSLKEKFEEREGFINLREGVRLLIFALVISSIERSVSSINKKEVHEIVEGICKRRDTPAYDLIRCLYQIDIADQFTITHRDVVDALLRKHESNEFLERIISWRVQHYFNTHREWDPTTHKVSDSVKQSTLALLRRASGKSLH